MARSEHCLVTERGRENYRQLKKVVEQRGIDISNSEDVELLFEFLPEDVQILCAAKALGLSCRAEQIGAVFIQKLFEIYEVDAVEFQN